MKRLLSVMTVAVIALCSMNYAKGENMSPDAGPQIVKEADWLVDKLDLRGDTALQFVKIYADYRTEMESVRDKKSKKEQLSGDQKKVARTENEIDADIRNGFDKSRKMIDVREKYYKKFKTILPSSKIEKMYGYEKKIINHKRDEMKRRIKMRDSQLKALNKNRKIMSKHKKRMEKNRKRMDKNRKTTTGNDDNNQMK